GFTLAIPPRGRPAGNSLFARFADSGPASGKLRGLVTRGAERINSPCIPCPHAKGSEPMTAPSTAALRLEILPDRIAVVTLDQPGSRANTLGQAIQGELEGLLDQLERQTDLAGL